MSTKINFSEIRQCIDNASLSQKIAEILEQCTPDDPISISDLLANKHRGGMPLIVELSKLDNEQMLRQLPRYTWKLEVLFDEWSNVPNPGDMVIRKHKRPLSYGEGKPIPGTELSQMKTDGSYSDELEYTTEFTVDEKGCITCTLHDAIHFLNLWGVHYRTKKPLCDKKAFSAKPVRRFDNQMIHVSYHRYKEADKHRYSTLSKRKKTDKRCEESTS